MVYKSRNCQKQLQQNFPTEFRYDTFLWAKNKCDDQAAWMRRLVCTFIVHKPKGQVFLRQGPICLYHIGTFRECLKLQFGV